MFRFFFFFLLRMNSSSLPPNAATMAAHLWCYTGPKLVQVDKITFEVKLRNAWLLSFSDLYKGYARFP